MSGPSGADCPVLRGSFAVMPCSTESTSHALQNQQAILVLLEQQVRDMAQPNDDGEDKQLIACTALGNCHAYSPFCSAPVQKQQALCRLLAAELW